MKLNANRVLAIMSVVMLATVVAVPALYEIEEVEAAPWLDKGTEEAIYWWLRVMPVASQIVGLYDYLTLDQREQSPAAGDDDTIKAYARDVDALRSAEQMYNIFGISASLVKTDTQTWKLSNAYLNRAAEIASGSLWYSGAQFDADAVLDYGGVYESIGNGNRNTSEILDEAVRVSADLKQIWESTNYGGPLNIGLVWSGGGSGNASDRLTLDFLTIADVTAQKNVVYLTQSSSAGTDTASTLWAYTTTGTITPIAPGSPSMSLNLGANDISALPSGFYVLSPGTYGGPLLSGVSDDAASVRGAAGIIKDNEYGYVTVSNQAIADGDYSKVAVYWQGAMSESSTLNFRITGSSEVQTTHDAPLDLITAYVAYYDQLTSLLHESAKSAQVMWSISATANSSNILLSPSSIIPSLRNANVDAEQSYALYVLALDQIGQYNTNYGGLLRDGMTKISAQSLDLYCHGDIHAADGTIVAKDVIFTPYVYVKDWTLFSGDINTMNQSGMVMIWDTGMTAAGWGGPASSDSYASLIMSEGQYMTVGEIHYKGQMVPSLKMEVVSVNQIEIFSGIDWDREDSPAVLSASMLIMVILVETAIILALMGWITGYRPLYLISLIILLIGAFGSEIVTRLILGLM